MTRTSFDGKTNFMATNNASWLMTSAKSLVDAPG